ncbi:TPX2 importin domain-containing protein [Citrus sinensis]|uniref:TPX2 importin domain-containing protein n=1 Tax=Citrus sinensis TaxID=2711 RepID=A0ACB8HTU5_CITSI|nr:TPX2 importin domain-containing protein [Citrus sinensis]
MDEEMEELVLTAEPIVAEEFEVDFDYEFDAPQYHDFTLPETPAKARENELWFDSAASYPPSPFILKFNWRYDFPADTASVSCDSRGGSMSSIGNVSYFETDSEAFDIYQINRGPEFCGDMDQDVSKSKTKSFAKSSIQRSSTLMKPTASYLAKYNQLQEFHFNHFLRSQKIVKSDKSSLNSSTIENLATKRQKLEAGFLPKVGLLEINSVNCRSKVTIPREPNLETAHRAQKHRAKAKVDAESDEHAKSNACNFKARPLNRKILEAPLPHPPKKSTPQPTEFQVILNMFESSCSSCDMSIFLDGFSEISLLHILGLTQIAFTAVQEFQLRTSERARQHACNNVATMHNHNAISQNETKDSRRPNSVDALKEEKCEGVKKIKANPLNKKISSGKGDPGVFRNIRQDTAASMDNNFPMNKGSLNEPPIDLFRKLSLASEVHNNLKSQSKMPLVSKESKENAPQSFLLEHEMKVFKEKSQKFGRNQYQCGSESSESRITEGGSRFNFNREIVFVVQVKRKVLIQFLPSCSLLKDFILCLMVPVSAICFYNSHTCHVSM